MKVIYRKIKIIKRYLLAQSNSSVLSSQSITPSHSFDSGIHRDASQAICSLLHSIK